MKKSDPSTKLPGVLLDKNQEQERLAKFKEILSKCSSMKKAQPAPAPAPAAPSKPAMPAMPKMQKPALPKPAGPAPLKMNELAKANDKNKRAKQQKGVHTPAFMDSYESGTSNVGARMAPGGASKETNQWAKEQHKEKISELKAMPKPNLPKSEGELEKAKVDDGKAPRSKAEARFERNKPLASGSLQSRLSAGVHKPAFGDKTGTSNMGAHLNDQARKEHVKRVSAESAKIKPNLPKSESSKTWGEVVPKLKKALEKPASPDLTKDEQKKKPYHVSNQGKVFQTK